VNKQQKEQVVAEWHDRFERAGSAILVQYSGLTTKEIEEIRKTIIQ